MWRGRRVNMTSQNLPIVAHDLWFGQSNRVLRNTLNATSASQSPTVGAILPQLRGAKGKLGLTSLPFLSFIAFDIFKKQKSRSDFGVVGDVNHANQNSD